VLAHRGITDRITPINQPLLDVGVHSSESCRDGCELLCRFERTGQRTLHDVVLRQVAPDGPVRSGSFCIVEGVNELTLPEVAYLVVDQVVDAKRMTGPVELAIMRPDWSEWRDRKVEYQI